MVFSTRKGKRTQPSLVSAMGAHNLWDILTATYQQIEQHELWGNFAHDVDLGVLLGRYKSHALEIAKSLEALCKQFSVKTADGPRRGMNASANAEVIYDEQIALWLLTMDQEALEMIFSALHTSVADDTLRDEFGKEVRWHIESLDGMIKFLRLKGWVSQPPLYPNVPKTTPEMIDTGEAYHLWDHLTFLYDSTALTDAYSEVAKDGDLVLILGALQKGLKSHTQVLEQEALKFGLPMPKPPERVRPKLESKELLDDDYILRHLLTQAQGTTLVHVSAFKQSTTNDRVRSMFKGMLLDAMTASDRLLKYSKVKGWIDDPPMYRL